MSERSTRRGAAVIVASLPPSSSAGAGLEGVVHQPLWTTATAAQPTPTVLK